MQVLVIESGNGFGGYFGTKVAVFSTDKSLKQFTLAYLVAQNNKLDPEECEVFTLEQLQNMIFPAKHTNKGYPPSYIFENEDFNTIFIEPPTIVSSSIDF